MMPNDALSRSNGILRTFPGMWELKYMFPSTSSCTWVGANPSIGTECGMTGFRAAVPRRT